VSRPTVYMTLMIDTDQAPEDVQLAILAALSDRFKIVNTSVNPLGGEHDTDPEVRRRPPRRGDRVTGRIPPEVTRVQGCDCGGLNMHRTDCALWCLDHGQATANVDAAKSRLAEYMEGLNAAAGASSSGQDQHTRHDEQSLIIASLLTGGTYLFGKRVELSWPASPRRRSSSTASTCSTPRRGWDDRG
jgi:hypothetical protein